jgi:hypothetical protein
VTGGEAISMRAGSLSFVAATALTVLPLLAQQPPAGPGGRGQVPAYTLTDQDRAALRSKLNQLDPLIAALKAKRGEDDLLADVEIHAKGGGYVVLNSGLTIAENAYTSDYSMPTLGDIAVLQVSSDSDIVVYAGFVDEFWRLP